MSTTPILWKRPSLILTPFLAFGLCLALTVGASFFAFESAKTENAGRFERSIGAFRDTLHNRMAVYTNALIYTRNLFNVEPNLSEREFHSFVTQMSLHEDYPGIRSLGYVERLSMRDARRVLSDMKLSEGDAKLRSAGATADLVRYVEVLSGESIGIRGIDIGGSLERRAAMDEAQDTGRPVATDHVMPMGRTESTSENAFLLFVPLYRVGLPLTTIAERRAAIRGFVYAGFRSSALFGRITEDARFRKAEFIVRVSDGDGSSPSQLMYSEGPKEISDPLMQRKLDFRFADHLWTIEIVAPQSYSVPALRWLPTLVFALGFLLSAALALALRRSQSLARRLQDDITVREQTEIMLSQARTEAEEANRAKSVFLANISHEIRTPLGVMLGFSELALHQESSHEREESLNTVIRNGRELTRIIGDVLDVSKLEAQTLKIEETPFSLSTMINDVIKIWKPQMEARGVEFKTEIDLALPLEVSSDETRIKQVLTNLLSNALKFTSQGRVVFRALKKEVGDGRAMLEFVVLDTGIGISDVQRERLFKPFSQGDSSITRKFGGSGLGLALSRSIAQTLGGELKLAPGVGGVGTCFAFTVPVRIAEMPRPVVSEGVVTLKGRRILLVDDSADNRALVSLMLKKAEASVDVAVDGDDGVQKALNRVYDLILMDIQMPNKDGYTALRELREHHLEIPVIALTAHALREERERALSVGFAAYITKPVDRETLVRVSAQTLTDLQV